MEPLRIAKKMEEVEAMEVEPLEKIDLNVPYRTDNISSAIRLFEEFVTSNTLDVEMARVERACSQRPNGESTKRS